MGMPEDVKSLLSYDPVVIGELPTEPDVVIMLRQYGGNPPEDSMMSDVTRFAYPGLQIIVRNPDYQTGYETIMTIFKKLTSTYEQTINGTRYISFTPNQTPSDELGRDENNRALFVVNFIVTMEMFLNG